MALWHWLGSMCAMAVLAMSTSARAQTVEGDILRGQGKFAAGAGWYNLNTAKANAINVEAMRNYNAEVRSNYDRIYNHYLAREEKKKGSKEDAKKRALEKIEQIKSNPTVDDIRNGEALNMIVLLLTDPEVQQKNWYTHAVALPSNATVKDIAFDYYPNRMTEKDVKVRVSLSQVSEDVEWPIAFSSDAFTDERAAYQQAVSRVKANVKNGKVEPGEIKAVQKALDGLAAEMKKVHHDNSGYKAAASDFHGELKAATKIFDGPVVDYSKELLRETDEYEAKTVGELVAFMLKYRLFFSKANSPRANALYNDLYSSMREQSRQLNAASPMVVSGSKPLEPVAAAKPNSSPQPVEPTKARHRRLARFTW